MTKHEFSIDEGKTWTTLVCEPGNTITIKDEESLIVLRDKDGNEVAMFNMTPELWAEKKEDEEFVFQIKDGEIYYKIVPKGNQRLINPNNGSTVQT